MIGSFIKHPDLINDENVDTLIEIYEDYAYFISASYSVFDYQWMESLYEFGSNMVRYLHYLEKNDNERG